jgi:hypothetical protein
MEAYKVHFGNLAGKYDRRLQPCRLKSYSIEQFERLTCRNCVMDSPCVEFGKVHLKLNGFQNLKHWSYW